MTIRDPWKRFLAVAPLACLLAISGVAHGQLSVGGVAFEDSDDNAATTTDNLELQVWVGLNELDGYNPGAFGADTDELSVAIATFQIKNSLDVTGEVSEELAQTITDQVRAQGGGASASASASAMAGAASGNPAGGEEDPCLRQEAAETARKTSRFARIARAGGRLFDRAGGDSEIANDVSQIANETGRVLTDVAIVSPDCQQ